MATDHSEALDKLAKLEDHWLLKEPPKGEDDKVPEATSETGLAPTREAIAAARAFIEDGGFFPTPVGGVQWEANAGGWDVIVTFNPDGTATLVYS